MVQGKWMKFNGKAEHETCPFEGTRVSFIVFTHNACEELDEAVVGHMEELGFTAGSAARKRDPGDVVESDFDAFFGMYMPYSSTFLFNQCVFAHVLIISS